MLDRDRLTVPNTRDWIGDHGISLLQSVNHFHAIAILLSDLDSGPDRTPVDNAIAGCRAV